MSLPTRHAFSAWAGLLGGALSVAEGILILSNPGYYNYDSPLDHLVLTVEGTALLVLLAALSGLHARLATSYGRTGAVGFLAAFAGTALAGAGHIGAVPFFDFLNRGGMVYPPYLAGNPPAYVCSKGGGTHRGG